jgi:uncharacterized protein (TIGR02246 family)
VHATKSAVLIVLSLVLLGFAALPACTRPAETHSAVEDRAEIEELVVRYVTALDTLDADAYANVFAENAEFDVTGTVYRGRDAIREIVASLEASRDASLAEGTEPARLYHVMSNTSIEIIDETEARHTSYAQTVRQADDGQFVVGFMGRYEDVIVKRDGRWQILSRKLISFAD